MRRTFCLLTEVAVQIALCETDEKAWDLYYAAYSHPGTLELIKAWSAKKNYALFKEMLPGWSKEDFQRVEHVASSIEYAAFTSVCNDDFTLEDKIFLITEALLKMYNIPEQERYSVLEKLKKIDCCQYGKELFQKFVGRLYSGEID